jgi:hypothetical protein
MVPFAGSGAQKIFKFGRRTLSTVSLWDPGGQVG